MADDLFVPAKRGDGASKDVTGWRVRCHEWGVTITEQLRDHDEIWSDCVSVVVPHRVWKLAVEYVGKIKETP